MRFYRPLTATVVALFACAGPAAAGGLYLAEFGQPGQGASGAGAGVLAQDASTAVTNPAGVMFLDESEWMITAVGLLTSAKFEQQAGTTVTGTNGSDAGGFLPAGGLFYANPINEKWGFPFAFNGIAGAALDYDAGFVGRYWAEEVDLLVLTATPSLAYRVNDNLSVSASIAVAYGQLDLDVAIPPLTPVAMGNDGVARIKDGDDVDINIGLGALWQVTDRVRLGLTYLSETDLEFDSDLEITLPVGTQLPQVSADVAIPFAQTVRFSASSDIGDNLTALAMIAWEDWSTLDNVLVSTDAAGGTLPKDWDDTWKFALGLRWRTGGPWTYHTGVAYDTDPTRASDRTADMPVDRQIRLSGGATYEFASGNRLGGVLTLADLGDARIDNGGDWGRVVGEYDTNWLIALGVNWAW